MSEDDQSKNVAATPAPRTKKVAKQSDEPNESPPRQSAAERNRQKLEERVRSYREALAAAEPSEFQKVLADSVKKLTAKRARREERNHLLDAALRLIPPSLSGVVVVKHFKMNSEWTKEEIRLALSAVAAVLRERAAEVEQMGPFVHGTLVSLVDAAHKQEGADGSAGEKVDLIAALLELHRALWDPSRAPLTAPGDNPVSKVIRQARELIDRYPSRADVQGIAGQRLFGFDEVFTPPPVRQDAAPAAVESSLPKPNPASVDAQSQSCVETKSIAPQQFGAVVDPSLPPQNDRLHKEIAHLERQLALSKQSRDSLRHDLDRERESVAELRRQLQVASEMRDGLSGRVIDLQEKLEVALQLEARLEEQTAANRLASAEIDRLRELLKTTESQARSAMESEFERGKAVTRFTIAKYFVEPLRQISDAVSGIDGDSAQFVRDRANQLRTYLEEGRG
jgi:hypothetical protein